MKIAVASGKGGTGKTFVSVNLFASLSNAGKEVSIVDCDAEEPNVAQFLRGELTGRTEVLQEIPVIDTSKCTFCGKCGEYCTYNAIMVIPNARYINVIEDLCHDCGACYVTCSHDAITPKKKVIGSVSGYKYNETCDVAEARIEVGTHSAVPVIKKAINGIENNRLTILDSPPGISCPFITTADRADYVVLVTEPTPFGLNDLKLSVDTLRELNKPFGVIVNRAGLGSSDVYDYLKDNNIPLLMEIPFDRSFASIYSNGDLLVNHSYEWEDKFVNLYEAITESMADVN